jgi:hypothetical protein
MYHLIDCNSFLPSLACFLCSLLSLFTARSYRWEPMGKSFGSAHTSGEFWLFGLLFSKDSPCFEATGESW